MMSFFLREAISAHLELSAIGASDGLDDCTTNIEILRLPIAKWIPNAAHDSLPTSDSVTPVP
jgi:hypothetical protein